MISIVCALTHGIHILGCDNLYGLEVNLFFAVQFLTYKELSGKKN